MSYYGNYSTWNVGGRRRGRYGEDSDDDWLNESDDDEETNDSDDEASEASIGDEKVPIFLMLIGIPGSGKTTWANQFKETLSKKMKKRTAKVAAAAKKKKAAADKKAAAAKKKASKAKAAAASVSQDEYDYDDDDDEEEEEEEEEFGPLSRREHMMTVVHSDQVRQEYCGSINDMSCLGEVWTEILVRVEKKLLRGLDVMLDATNVDTMRRRSFVRSLPHCRLRVKFFEVNPAVAVERIAKDLAEKKNRANVPARVVCSMDYKFDETKEVIHKERFRVFDEKEYFDGLGL